MDMEELTDIIRELEPTLPATRGSAIVKRIFGEIAQALSRGEEVKLYGFGKFSVNERPARAGRNPRTGETIDLSADRTTKFKPAKRLRDALNPAPRVGGARRQPMRKRA